MNLVKVRHTYSHMPWHICASAVSEVRSGRQRAAILALVILFTSSLHTSTLSANELVEKSPFLPPDHNAKPAEPEKPEVQPQGPISRELEFRGIVKMDGKYQFSIYNKKDQKGYWLTENEAAKSGLVVRDFDADSSSVIVNMNGRSERLTLADTSDSPMPVAQAKPTTPNQASPVLPPQLNNRNQAGNSNNKRTIPRRRVILPKKTN